MRKSYKEQTKVAGLKLTEAATKAALSAGGTVAAVFLQKLRKEPSKASQGAGCTRRTDTEFSTYHHPERWASKARSNEPKDLKLHGTYRASEKTYRDGLTVRI